MPNINENVFLDASVSPMAGYTYNWTLSSGLSFVGGSNAANEDIFVTSNTPGTYTATIEVFAPNGCSVGTESKSLTFSCGTNQKPRVRIRHNGGDGSFFDPARVIILIDNNCGGFDSITTTSGTLFTGSGNQNLTWSGPAPTITVTNTCGCSTSVTLWRGGDHDEVDGACCGNFPCVENTNSEICFNNPGQTAYPDQTCAEAGCSTNPCQGVNCGCGTCINGTCDCSGTCPGGDVCSSSGSTCTCVTPCSNLPSCNATASNAPCCCNNSVTINTPCASGETLVNCVCTPPPTTYYSECNTTTYTCSTPAGGCTCSDPDCYCSQASQSAATSACNSGCQCTGGLNGQTITYPTLTGDFSYLEGIRIDYCPSFTPLTSTLPFIGWSVGLFAKFENYLLNNSSTCSDAVLIQNSQGPDSFFVTATHVSSYLNSTLSSDGSTASVSVSPSGVTVSDPSGEINQVVVFVRNDNVDNISCNTTAINSPDNSQVGSCC
jgi:hypothetical protein